MDKTTDHVSNYLEQYRNTTLALVSNSENCTHGTWWIWLHFGQCLEETSQMIGFGFGLLAVPLWAIGHVLLYSLQRRRNRTGHRQKMWWILFSHWLVDVLSCSGALLSHQLASQVVFALSAIVVDSMVGLHWTFFRKPNKTSLFYTSVGERRSWCSRITRRIAHVQAWVLSTISVICFCTVFSIENPKSLTVQRRSYNDWRTVKAHADPVWIAGYVIGCVATILHWLVELPEVVYSYRTAGIGKQEVRPHVMSVLGDTAYLYSVLSQSSGFIFLMHTLPWTLDRMGQNGIHIGIILQRLLIKNSGRRRSLSGEDTELLMSSGSEIVWSSDESEVIWSSEKPIPAAVLEPGHSCTGRKIQILSDTEIYSDDTKTSHSKSVELIVPQSGKDSTEGVTSSSKIDVVVSQNTCTNCKDNLKTHISSLDQDSRLDRVVQWFRKSLGDSDVSDADEESDPQSTPASPETHDISVKPI